MIVRNIGSRSNEMSAHHRAKSPLTISEMRSMAKTPAGADLARSFTHAYRTGAWGVGGLESAQHVLILSPIAFGNLYQTAHS